MGNDDQLGSILSLLEKVNTKLENQEKQIAELKLKIAEKPEADKEGYEDEEGEPITPPIPPPEKSETEKRVDQLEEMFRSLSGSGLLTSGFKDCELKGKLPKKVVLNDLPKFRGVEDPEDHLRAFTISMSLKGMDKELFASVFPLTLDTHPAKWFKSLNKVKVDDWDYIKEEFLKQYCYNSQLPIGLRELEATKQNEHEDFVTFLTRWREKAAQMTNRPTEEDQVRIVIRNLQPKYHEHLKFQPIDTFPRLYKIGLLIEEELQAHKAKGSYNNFNKRGGSSSSNSQQNKNAEVGSVSTNDSFLKQQKPKRHFTPLGMTQEQAFDRLTGQGLISPIGPTPDPSPENRSKNWNPNAYCKYHQGKGHNISDCWTLRHKLQDMIEDGRLPIPPGAKPNTKTNPLPTPWLSLESLS